jgi:hypothetical protein
MVQQVLDESRGKRHVDGSDVNAAAMGAGSATTPGLQPNPSRASNPGGQREPKLPTTLLPGSRVRAGELVSARGIFSQATYHTCGNRGCIPGNVRKGKGADG